MHSAPGNCPVCGHTFKITQLRCDECGSELRGDFGMCRFCSLDSEQMKFLTVFLQCRGSLKDMEKVLGISYPTIKNRLEALPEALELQERPKLTRADVLEAIRKGEIKPEAAVRLLEKTDN